MKNPLCMICDKGPEKSKGPEKAIDFGMSIFFKPGDYISPSRITIN